MNYTQESFITSELANRLELFKKIESGIFNFRCPVCGDSRKNKTKARGYLLNFKSNFIYKCHNCDCAVSFSVFLEILDKSLYRKYIIESLKNKKNYKERKKESLSLLDKKKKKLNAVKNIEHIFPENIHVFSVNAPESLKAKLYLTERQIPEKYHSLFYYTKDFAKFVKVLNRQEIGCRSGDERLIIPFLNRANALVGISGRSLDPKNSQRYIKINLFPDFEEFPAEKLIFGLNRVRLDERVYVLEGQFDSLFLTNAVSVGGSDMKDLSELFPKAVYIFDNEPSNSAIVKKMERIIKSGERIVIWPSYVKEKDINEMILKGKKTSNQIELMINENTYESLEAKSKFIQWKKV